MKYLNIFLITLLVLFKYETFGASSSEPILTTGYTPYQLITPTEIKSNGSYFATIIPNNKIYFWNNITNRSISLYVGEEYSFELLGDKLFVGDFSSFGVNTMTEYDLTNFVSGLPTALIKKTNFNWSVSPEGRWVRSIKTENNNLVFITHRHRDYPKLNCWNNDVIIRGTNGVWKSYYREYSNLENRIGSTQYRIVQSSVDKRLYFFATRDSFGFVALARWKDTPSGDIEFVDFRENFLCNKFQNGYLIDGNLSPDSEFPYILAYSDPYNQRIVLSYQSDVGSIYGGWWRLAHPIIAEVKVLPDLPRPKIIEYHFLPYNQISLSFTSITNRVYGVEYSLDLKVWKSMNDIYVNDDDIRALHPITDSLVYIESADKFDHLFLRVVPRNYERNEIAFLPEYVERANTTLPLIPKSEGIYYYVNPYNCDYFKTNLFFGKFDYGTKSLTNFSTTPIDYDIISIGKSYRIIGKTNSLILQKF